MRLIKKEISEKDGEGSVSLRPEEEEDMWHAYNLIAQHDVVKSTTVRKVTRETATGSTDSQRIRMTLGIEVEKVEFDPEGGVLRLSGKNVTENEHVRIGAHHTLDMELQRNFTVTKTCWDQVYLDLLAEATDVARAADVAAVVMQSGVAHLCLITGSMTHVKAKIESHIPKKGRGDTKAHDKAFAKFYDLILQAILKHINFEVIKCVLLASPGFVKDQFYEFMFEEAVKKDIKELFHNKPKFMLCHSSSGFKHALKEVLMEPNVLARLADTKAAKEVSALTTFFNVMQEDQDRAVYGYTHVSTAVEQCAVDTLMLSDNLFRARKVAERKKYVELVETARASNATVHIFSSLHVSGEQLAMLAGVAATLRFPMPQLNHVESGSEEEEEDEAGAPHHSSDLPQLHNPTTPQSKQLHNPNNSTIRTTAQSEQLHNPNKDEQEVGIS